MVKITHSTESTETRYLDVGGDQKAYMDEVMAAGAKGIAAGLVAYMPFNYWASRRVGWYKMLPPAGKLFVGMMTVVPIGVVFAEKAGEHHIAKQWSGVGKSELDHQAQVAEQRWNSLTTTQKLKDWASRHQYGIIGGSWVASIGISFAIVARNKYQTFPQKLVQARMWAQGLTVAVLMASAVMAGVNAKGKKPELPADHSWADILEQSGTLSKADRIRLHTAKKVAASTPPAAEASAEAAA